MMMSLFQMPGYASGDAAKLEEMSRDLASSFRADTAAAMNLMAQPAASFVALSALGLGFVSHAFGFWTGTVAGAAEASQRLLVPFAPQGEAPVERSGQADARVQPPAFQKPKPALKVVPKAEPAKRPTPVQQVKAVETVTTVSQAEPTVPAKTDALLPEDFRKPGSIERPAVSDDLKAISGIGPKLEKVLNDLGVWTYAQIAAWEKDEVAWTDDYLGFKGRIGRDGWIAQARSLSGAKVRD